MALAYLELKLSWQLHRQTPEKLPQGQRAELRLTAQRQEALEHRILQSPEAMCAHVPPAETAARLAEIRARYASEAEFVTDLARLGLDAEALAAEIARELVIESVLERVGGTAPAVSETEAEIFYHLHPQRFTRPETRVLRHILLTAGDPAARRAARALLERLRRTQAGATAFAAAALRHSHCPTALDGGRLGLVRRGKLYPELEQAAFALAADEVSPVVATELGLHLVRCDAIEPERRLAFAEVRAEVLRRLSEARQEKARRQWIAALRRECAA